MRLYVTNLGTWFSTRAEADRAMHDDGALGFTLTEVPTDKAGLLGFLNSHRVCREVAEPASAQASPAERSYADQTIRFEDAFEAMPLPLKLHFAALAMEAARDAIGGEAG